MSRAPVVVEVGRRKASLSPGCRFWTVSYRPKGSLSAYNPAGYKFGSTVSASRVREVLIELNKRDVERESFRETEALA